MTAPVRSRLSIRILASVAILFTLFVLLMPQDPPDGGTGFSSYSTSASGTRALYDVLTRLGYTVERNIRPIDARPDSNAVYMLLNPAQPLTSIEESNLLAAVRHGATLVFTLGDAAFADSLDFEAAIQSSTIFAVSTPMVAGGDPSTTDSIDIRAAIQSTLPATRTVMSTSKDPSQVFMWLAPVGPDSTARGDSTKQQALVVGHRVGRGYAVAVAPARIVVNSNATDPHATIAIIRAIQFGASATGHDGEAGRVVFDEYHHGYGQHADMVAAVQRGLTGTPVGRATIVLIVAALFLLLAHAVRPLAPVSIPPITRRSPLEHVGALAYAYAQTHATVLGTNRLIRGLRRRHPLGVPASLPDVEYMAIVRARVPAVAADVDRILAVSSHREPEADENFAATGAAIANIERAIAR